MKICPKCKTQYPDDVNFCNECGSQLMRPLVQKNMCPSCFSELKDGVKFCGNCGAKIDAASAAGSSGDMVLIQGGTFKMGSNNGDDNEKPVHSVTVASFRICKYQVTQYDWTKIMGENPSRFKDNPANGEKQGLRPVESVSWFDAIEYCNMRSMAEGLTLCYTINAETVTCNWNANGYRLPTEAEWEYAARGGGRAARQSDYSGGYSMDEVGWYYNNSGGKTHQVGLKAPNAAGLYDMSGNVGEWCWDWYGDYPSGAVSDPRGASSGEDRVDRGGTWNYDADDCRVSFRDGRSPDYRDISLGLRVCCRA